MPDTVMTAFAATVARHPAAVALCHKEDGHWRSRSFSAYYDEVRSIARGFIALGLDAGQTVSILGGNGPQWLIADLAAIAAGGVAAGIYATSSTEQCHYIARHSATVIAVVEDRSQLAKFLEVRHMLPALRAIVLMEGHSDEPGVYAWSQMSGLAAAVPESELQSRIDVQRADAPATLIYTSGTTGTPKAVVLSHANLVWTARAAAEHLDAQSSDEWLSYLPLPHVAEQILTLHLPLHVGNRVWFAESLDRLAINLGEVRPHRFLGVPRVWEKMQTRILDLEARAAGSRRWLMRWARSIGRTAAVAQEKGRRPPLLWPLADRIVLSKIRRRLGLDRSRHSATGAAPVSPQTVAFFASIGLPLHEIYGQSESTGACTLSAPGRSRTGSVGMPWRGIEVRLADDGEILVRGSNVFLGYLHDEAATRVAKGVDGWLRTGDVGRIDAQGFLYIVDRKKELIITAGGENISPAHVEGVLKSIPSVGHSRDRRPAEIPHGAVYARSGVVVCSGGAGG